ncbi:hypothetical protein Golax_022516, partial [Gossypium laxum]|nr:hypothetical protein [Gossypium laxum]
IDRIAPSNSNVEEESILYPEFLNSLPNHEIQSIEELNQSFGVCNGQFDNDRVTLLLLSEPGNPLYMMQNESCSIIDQRNLYEKYESEFEEGEGEGVLDPSSDRGGFIQSHSLGS